MNRLTKKQALDLLPAVIDGEASENERLAFLAYIETDPDVRDEYESSLRIKELLAKKLFKKKAPAHLRNKVYELIEESQRNRELRDISPDERPDEVKPGQLYKPEPVSIWKPTLRYLAAAAVLLFITLTIVELLDRMTTTETGGFEIVENYSAIHFLNSEGRLSEFHYSTASISDAEQYLLDHHGITMTIPPVKGAEFAGIIIADFYNGMEAPLLGYHQHDIDETIFIFAFENDKIASHKKLKRLSDAVEKCRTNTDFYVAEIENHHVVSWTWDGNWYTAVSNHNGYDLAALIEPLNYSP
jgi:hypothetical protein